MIKRRLIIAFSIIALCIIGYAAYYLSTKSSRSLRNEIISMQGKKVDLSFSEAEVYHSVHDTVYEPGRSMKLVLFVDSLSCSGCFLNKLITYYEINDSLVKNNGQLVVILNPKQIRIDEIRKSVIKEKHPFYCIIDKTGEFLRDNPWIPDNQLLHSFALDANDTIILVGDPISNPKINELFMKQLANISFQDEISKFIQLQKDFNQKIRRDGTQIDDIPFIYSFRTDERSESAGSRTKHKGLQWPFWILSCSNHHSNGSFRYLYA